MTVVDVLQLGVRSQAGPAGSARSVTPGAADARGARVTTDGDFAAYVAARLPALLRFAHALTGNRDDAADLVQDTLLKVGLHWERIRRDDAAGVDAYVRRAIANGRVSRWRRRRGETLVADVPERVAAHVDPLEHEPLWQALRGLPARQRAVIVLRYYDDLTEAEIAATLGISTGTVKSQASRAMATLRTRLGAAEAEGSAR